MQSRSLLRASQALLGVMVLAASATASAANKAPTISGSPPTSVTVGTKYWFVPVGQDADGDSLKFSIANKPAWMTIFPKNGALYGEMTAAHVGTYKNLVISVTDGKATKALPPFTINVIADKPAATANRAPTISGTPPSSVLVGKKYWFVPVGKDADGDNLTFSIANKPAWMTIFPKNGALYGEMAAAHVGTYKNLVISVTDGKKTTSLPPFTISVVGSATSGNQAPVLSGIPSQDAQAGSAYLFKPSASDADKDTLAFTIANKPVWAQFNTLTGELRGTPTVKQAGVYSSIKITVSDGKSNVALPAFAIVVKDTLSGATSGVASLSWAAPLENSDGSVLTNLAGFIVNYGTDKKSLTQSVKLANPGISRYMVEELKPGTYYFSVQAFNSKGAESAPSEIVSKNIQ